MKNIILFTIFVISTAIIILIYNNPSENVVIVSDCETKGFAYDPVFTRKIILQQPVDELHNSHVSIKELYFHTQIIGLADTSISHQWYKEDKLIESLDFPISTDRQSTWSKLPQHNDLLGTWQVNVVLDNCVLTQSTIIIGQNFQVTESSTHSPWKEPLQAGEFIMQQNSHEQLTMSDEKKRNNLLVFVKNNKGGMEIDFRKNNDPADDYLSTLIKNGQSIETIERLSRGPTKDNAFLNRRSLDGDTPLMEAIKANNEQAVSTLLEYKVNLYLKDSNGQSALDLSYLIKNKTIQNKIIEKMQQGHYLNNTIKNIYNNKTINSRNRYGDTPLISAIRYNNNAVIVELLKLHHDKNSYARKHAANLYAFTDNGESTLEFAKNNNLNSAALLLEKAMQDSHVPWAVTRFTVTNKIKDSEPQNCIKSVSNKDSKLSLFAELMDLKGHVVTHQWLFEKQLKYSQDFHIKSDFLKTISRHQPDENNTGYWQVQIVNDTGMILAEGDFQLQPAEKFRNQYNRDISECNLNKNSLEKLVKAGAPLKKLKQLLKQSNFDARYIKEIFHLAIEQQHIGTIKAFIERGIDIEIQSKHGVTPLITAIKNNRDIAARFLLNHNADMYTKIHFDKHHALEVAVGNNDIRTVKVMLNSGFDINYTNGGYMTALHRAIKAGCLTEITKLLLNNGADANILWQKKSAKDFAKINNCWLLDEWKKDSMLYGALNLK